MYHGTDANFTEFNTDNKRTSGKLNFGKEIYLTPNIAEKLLSNAIKVAMFFAIFSVKIRVKFYI